MKIAKHIMLFWLFLAVVGQLQAQAIFDTLNLLEFEVVDYHANHIITSKTQTIDSLEMRMFSQQDLGDALSALAPVYVKSYGRGTLSTVSFRGLAAAHTQLLWEGFRVNSPMLGQVDFSLVPNSLFSSAEINSGGATLMLSGGAFGGLVSLSNLTERNEKNSFQFEQSVGSFDTYMSSLSVNLGVKNFSSTTKAFTQTSANNFSYYNNAMLPAETMKQKQAGFANIGFVEAFTFKIAPNQELFVVSWNQWSARDLSPIMTNVFKLQVENQSDFTSRTVFGWKHKAARAITEVKAAYFHETYNYFLKTLSSDSVHNTVVLTDSRNIISSGFVKANTLIDLGCDYLFTVSLDLEHQAVNSKNYIGIKTRNAAISMISLEKKYRKWLMLKALIRSEYSDDAFLPLLPYVGLSMKPFRHSQLYFRANMSGNYKRPTLNELYFFPMGNPDLKPEQATQFEGAIDYKLETVSGHELSLGLSAYYSDVHNWVQWLPGEFEYWIPENVSQVVSKGLEFSSRWKFSFKDWAFRAMAQYVYANVKQQDVEIQKIQMPYIPDHRVNGYIDIAWLSYYLRWGTNYTGERFTTLDPEKTYSNTLPSFWLHDVTFGSRFSVGKAAFEAKIKIYNVFDVSYQAVLWRAMPGRNAEVSLLLKW